VHRDEIGDERLEAGVLQPEPLGDRDRELVGADEPLLEQDLAHRAAGGARLADDVLDGLAVAEAEADDDVAEQSAGTDASGGFGRLRAVSAGRAQTSTSTEARSAGPMRNRTADTGYPRSDEHGHVDG
jgi:hypothetical protein